MATERFPILYLLVGLFVWFWVGAALGLVKGALQYIAVEASIASSLLRRNTADAKRAVYSASQIKQARAVEQFIDSLNQVLKDSIRALNRAAQNFIGQVVVKYQGETNVQALPPDYNVFDMPHAGQQIIGALLEFVLLLCFLYADASLAAQTYSVIFNEPIPVWLNQITIPLIMASSGSALILGVFIGDILGLTHFGAWGLLRGRTGKGAVFGVVLANLLVVIVLAGFVSLYRAEVLGVRSETLRVAALYAQSLVIVPLLITTALLMHGLFGVLVILAILLQLVAIPIAVLLFFSRILGQWIEIGVVQVEVFFLRLLWLVLLAFDLLFGLMDFMIRGGFVVLASLLVVCFYIPYVIVNLPLRKFAGTSVEEFLGQVLDTSQYAPSTAVQEERRSSNDGLQ